MHQATAPDPPTPRPSLPRTIGVLNIGLGFLLLLCGTGGLWVASSLAGKGDTFDPEMTRITAQELRRNFLEELRQHEAAATSEAEKNRLRQERERLEGRPDSIAGHVDFTTVNRGTRRFAQYMWLDVVSAPILNLLMFVAGLGLVRLRRWGLRLGVWVAGLKLLRIVALGVFAVVFMIPTLNRAINEFKDTDFTEIPTLKMQEDQKHQSAAGSQQVVLATGDLLQVTKSAGYIGTVLYLCLAAIYPLVALIVLTRPAAVASVGGGSAPTDEPQSKSE